MRTFEIFGAPLNYLRASAHSSSKLVKRFANLRETVQKISTTSKT
jgi:hypothetical protein